VGKSVLGLEKDLRLVMEPYTARNLKVCFFIYKDFVHWCLRGEKHIRTQGPMQV